MSGATCTPEDLAAALADQLSEYGKTTTEEVDNIISEVGREACERVRAASPRRKGAYRRGWKVKIERRGSRTEVTVHNAKRYQLTHLLEFGHRTRLRSGKYGSKAFVAAQPHIGEVNDWAQREVERKIREKLGGG